MKEFIHYGKGESPKRDYLYRDRELPFDKDTFLYYVVMS